MTARRYEGIQETYRRNAVQICVAEALKKPTQTLEYGDNSKMKGKRKDRDERLHAQ
jgi:hypothetical protein